jgi:Flp pilus assembly protein TadB
MPCPYCGAEWTQKSRPLLFLVGLSMLIAGIIALLDSPVYWIVAAMFLAISAYLLVWSTLGKGRWCRRCKKFSIS